MGNSWFHLLDEEFEKPYMKQLEAFLEKEQKAGQVIYPPSNQLFSAFLHAPYEQVKVVIMGQDPYHGPDQAHGLSFSVPKGIPLPPSLKNIFKELKEDLGVSVPNHGCLETWASQGILLLNATLTVRAHEPKSHFGQGWEIFTDRVIQLLSARKTPIVFVLWGKSAYEKFHQVQKNASSHLVLTAPHPSPFSCHSGFFGCRHFSKINEFLVRNGSAPIDWEIR